MARRHQRYDVAQRVNRVARSADNASCRVVGARRPLRCQTQPLLKSQDFFSNNKLFILSEKSAVVSLNKRHEEQVHSHQNQVNITKQYTNES